ncbi:MAG: hypothetical protein M0Z64_08070 [Nitrospiraceae bacterium]|nr:hypothetical protein [Nitrospiraceae bacterium]
MKKGDRTIQLYDAYLTAYLRLKNFPYRITTINGTVVFEFPIRDELLSAIEEFKKSEFAQFSAEVKAVRGLIRAYRD